MSMLTLKSGREKSLLRHHPWVFSGAVASQTSGIESGGEVEVRSSNGEFLGKGFYSPQSQLRVRIAAWDVQERLTSDWLRGKIASAQERRAQMGLSGSYRVVHGESDGLPGLILDRYESVLSVQILSAGMERFRAELGALLLDLFPEVSAVYERSDAAARSFEGLAPHAGVLALREGVAVPDFTAVPVSLGAFRTVVNIAEGQKTGSYLDQRLNHEWVGAYAQGREVLDAFCYDGGFTVQCLRGGASKVTAMDSSAAALSLLSGNVERNGFSADAVERCCADVFTQLRKYRDSRRSFDLIILDPPKFADSRAHLQRACRAYKDINLLAFKLLRPGGLLATFSCSGAVDPALFQTVVAEAASDAHRDARIVRSFLQAPDHPVLLSFPESLYLKGLLLQV